MYNSEENMGLERENVILRFLLAFPFSIYFHQKCFFLFEVTRLAHALAYDSLAEELHEYLLRLDLKSHL